MINRIIAVFVVGLLSASVFAREPDSPKKSVFFQGPESPELMALENLNLLIKKERISGAELRSWGLRGDKKGPASVEHDGFRYSLEFSNDGRQSLTNLTVRYRCYYQLSQSWDDESKNKQSVEFYPGEMGIVLIEPKGRFETETEPFVLFSTLRRRGDFDTESVPARTASELVGLCVRVFQTTAEGEEKHREFWSLSPSHSVLPELKTRSDADDTGDPPT